MGDLPLPDLGIDSDRWRDYVLLVELGLKPADALEMAAVDLDWLLAIHGRIQLARSERTRNG